MGFSQVGILVLSLSLLSVTTPARAAPRPIKIPASLLSKLESFEPSAAVYLSDLGRYLVGCDGTTAENSPWLFLMDPDGRVAAAPVVVKGIEKMSDIESISQEGDDVYLLSSMGLKKNGKDKRHRNLFVHATRKRDQLTAKKSIDLREPLIEALEKSKIPELKAMRGLYEEELDVESHFVKDGNLYVGLKKPQPRDGTALILDLGRVSQVLSGRLPPVELYAKIDFRAVSDDKDVLSDMSLRDGYIYLTSTVKRHTGRFWKYRPQDGKPKLIREFYDVSPEAVAVGRTPNDSLLLFDQGDEEGLFSFESLRPSRAQ